jgi:cytochrome P450
MARSMKDIPVVSGADTLVGHAKQFQEDQLGAFLKATREASRADGVAALRFFGLSVLVVSSPPVLHELLVEKSRAFGKSLGVRTLLYPITGEGLFTSDGDLWKRQRKLMAPLFSAAYMESYTDGMSACIDREISAWRPGDEVDIGREMTRITMAVVSRTLFGLDTRAESDELGEAITDVLEYMTQASGKLGLVVKMQVVSALEALARVTPPALSPALSAVSAPLLRLARGPFPLPTRKSRRVHAAIEKFNGLILRMIQERRAAGLSQPDLLSKLLAARDEDDGATMSDQQVHDEMLTLFFAGHETTAVATSWALYLLGRHPDIYRKLMAEVDALGGRSITYADLPRLPYTRCVFKEALRLYPPAVLIDRQTLSDVELGGYLLPRGTIVFLSPFAIHRDPELWPDPETFDPERFTPEAEAARPRVAYLPFGAGPRVCIGNHFALMEAQLVLARITQRFTLSALEDEPNPPVPMGTLRPRRPIRMQVRAREADILATGARPA